jgi:hypothetical protein
MLSALFSMLQGKKTPKPSSTAQQVAVLAAQLQRQSEEREEKETRDFRSEAVQILAASSSDQLLYDDVESESSIGGSSILPQADSPVADVPKTRTAVMPQLAEHQPIDKEALAQKLHSELHDKYKTWYQGQLPSLAMVETVVSTYPLFKETNTKLQAIEKKIKPYLQGIYEAISDSKIEDWNMRDTEVAKKYESYGLGISSSLIFLGSNIKLLGDNIQSKGSYAGTEIFSRLNNMVNDELLPDPMRESITTLLQSTPVEVWIEHETLRLAQKAYSSTLYEIHGGNPSPGLSEGTYLDDDTRVKEILIPGDTKLNENHVIHKVNKLFCRDYAPGSLIQLLAFLYSLSEPLKIKEEKLFDIMSFIQIDSQEEENKIQLHVEDYSKFMRLLLSVMKNLIVSTDGLAKEAKRDLRTFIASIFCDRGHKVMPWSCDQLEKMSAQKFFKILSMQVMALDTCKTHHHNKFVYEQEDDTLIQPFLQQLKQDKAEFAKRHKAFTSADANEEVLTPAQAKLKQAIERKGKTNPWLHGFLKQNGFFETRVFRAESFKNAHELNRNEYREYCRMSFGT